MAATIRSFDGYELDQARFELRHGRSSVPIEPQVFELLAYLVARRDRVVSKDELIAHVWPDGYISDSALHTQVMAARKAIGDTGRDQRLIRTIRGRGFRFVGAVDEARPSHEPSSVAQRHSTASSTSVWGARSLGLDIASTPAPALTWY